MSDDADRADERMEFEVTARIAASRTRPRELMPIGTCHFCNELLPRVGQVFCDADCSTDFERENRLRTSARSRAEDIEFRQ